MPKKLPKSIAAVSLLLIILIVLLGSGFLLVKKNPDVLKSASLSEFSLLQVFKKTPAPTPSSQVDDTTNGIPLTVDWKTYSNPTYGFSFLYPQEYTPKHVKLGTDKSITVTFGNPAGKQILVEVKSKYIATEVNTFLGKTPDSGVNTTKGVEWVQFYLNGNDGKGEEIPMRAQTEKNNKFYSITMSESYVNILETLDSFTINP